MEHSKRLIGMSAAWAVAVILCSGASGAEDPYESARQKLVNQLVSDLSLKNQRVIGAMRKTPRHQFVPADQRRLAYQDLSLPIGNGQTISAPWAVAYMTEQIDPQPTDRVLEIGTGSGYQAAVLADLVKEVYTIEIVEPLGLRAERTLRRLGYKNVYVKVGDGYQGWPEKAPFDKIVVTCSPEEVPQPLVEQLKEGGRMLIPVGERYQQKLYLMEKREGTLAQRALVELVFVPMTGEAESLRQQQPDPANPQLVNGDFENDENKDGQPDGWHYRRQVQLETAEAPQGERYVMFTNDTAGREAVALQALALDGRAVQALEVSLSVRVQRVRQGTTKYQAPQLVVTFYDENRHSLRDETIGPWSGTADWQRVEQRIAVPPRTREAIVRIGLLGATGKASFDDIALRAVAREGKK